MDLGQGWCKWGLCSHLSPCPGDPCAGTEGARVAGGRHPQEPCRGLCDGAQRTRWLKQPLGASRCPAWVYTGHSGPRCSVPRAGPWRCGPEGAAPYLALHSLARVLKCNHLATPRGGCWAPAGSKAWCPTPAPEGLPAAAQEVMADPDKLHAEGEVQESPCDLVVREGSLEERCSLRLPGPQGCG